MLVNGIFYIFVSGKIRLRYLRQPNEIIAWIYEINFIFYFVLCRILFKQ